MNAIVMQAELALQDILAEHDELLNQARGFGMRTAAIPRGLMPLKEAQGIVAKFDDNTRKLKEFLTSLGDATYRAPDKATRDALNEISEKGSKALRKFEDDLTKAKAALLKHEDLLVGENFQDMFQALRLAVLDLDLTDKADIGAKTHLHLDATPAYAIGLVGVWRNDPREEVYRVRATYRAETDEYVADMWSKKSNRWFPASKKTGHTRIPAFVKAVVDKLKAVHDLEGEDLLGSRRTVEDTSKEVSGYRGEIAEQRRKALMEKGYQEAERKITEISQAIDRKLRQQFPKGHTETHHVERNNDPRRVVTWNSLTVGDTEVQLASNIYLNEDWEVSPYVSGNYGFYSGGGKLDIHVPRTSAQQYVDAAVAALTKFVIPDPKVTRTLTRKIEDVASQVRSALAGSVISFDRDKTYIANGAVRMKYRIAVKSGYYPRPGGFEIEARSGDRFLRVNIEPVGESSSKSNAHYSVGTAAEQIVKALKVPSLVTPTPAPVPVPTPAPTPAPSAQTPHIRAVLSVLRGPKIGYPGTLGSAAETEIDKVLTGAVPSITLSASKLSAVENPTDPAAVATAARNFQEKYHGGTAQVGNITITQTVNLKYRAQRVNLLLTIPSKDARLPGPTNPSVDLAGSVAEYFARGSGGPIPAQVRGFIADIEVTISRQGAVGRTAGTTRTAGATTFENLVWIPNVRAAFNDAHQEALETYGHRDGYSGTISRKHGYQVRSQEVMTLEAARAFANKDVNNNDKWDDNAFAVPVSKERVLATDKVTVSVTARDEKEALRQAKMRIYATGRFPPNASATVSELVPKKISETPRTKTFEVTGTRKVVMTGTTDGWLFYGWAPE